MYQGKYVSAASSRANSRSKRNRRNRWRKQTTLLVSIVTLLCVVVGGSLAYLFTHSDAVTNTFTVPEVDVTIPEEFETGDTEKKNVKVTNSCDFPVYVRATYVAYFQDDAGNVSPEVPELNISINTSDWTYKSDGYYLYNGVVGANGTTNNFINSASLNGTAPEGYHLVIDVIGEVVQAEPAQAIKDVWVYDAPGANAAG